METIEQAKIHLRQGWETTDGVECPCCGQLVKLYPRQIYYAPARALIALYWKDRERPDYYHIRDLDVDIGGSDFSKLQYWGLIKKCPKNDNPEKKSSGRWGITKTGRLFVEDRTKVPKYARIYDNKVVGFEGELRGIRDALGKKFSYSELMGFLI